MRKKLKEKSGETIIEALVSLLIVVISLSLLATSVVAAGKINARAREKLTEGFAFSYSDVAKASGKASIAFDDISLSDSADIIISEKNGYQFYERK